MRQNAPKTDDGSRPQRENSIMARIARGLAGGASAFALSLPLASPPAMAGDWQVVGQHYSGGWIRTYRKIRPNNGGVIELKGGVAPGNNCQLPAFEVMNPRRGEARCVGYVVPY